jgi:hypothetical protein
MDSLFIQSSTSLARGSQGDIDIGLAEWDILGGTMLQSMRARGVRTSGAALDSQIG